MKKTGGVWEIIKNGAGTAPTSNPYTPGGGIRPDVVVTDGAGQAKTLLEMKFPGDKLNKNQVPGGNYSKAAKKLGADYEVLEVEDDCDCWKNGPPPGSAPVTAPSTEESSGWETAGKVGLGLATGLAVFGCFASGICEAVGAATATFLGIGAAATAMAN